MRPGWLALALSLSVLATSTGCVVLAAGAVGGTAGYMIRKGEEDKGKPNTQKKNKPSERKGETAK